ncbi:MAG: hypothetical protein ACYTG0_20720 [Planctomycetota bacterium]|jgi:uncharacterized protein (TIGR03067 family)
MGCLQQVVVLSHLMIAGGDEPAAPMYARVHQEGPRQYVVVERPGRPPVIVGGSDEILARDDLAGTWQVKSLEHEGQPRPDVADGLQMRFTRGRLELMQGGRGTIVVAYNLNLKHYPHHFAWVLHGNGWLTQQKGVYWLEGDRLALCVAAVGGRRATEFLTQPADGRTMFVLERISPADEPPLLKREP